MSKKVTLFHNNEIVRCPTKMKNEEIPGCWEGIDCSEQGVQTQNMQLCNF